MQGFPKFVFYLLNDDQMVLETLKGFHVYVVLGFCAGGGETGKTCRWQSCNYVESSSVFPELQPASFLVGGHSWHHPYHMCRSDEFRVVSASVPVSQPPGFVLEAHISSFSKLLERLLPNINRSTQHKGPKIL